MELQPIKSRRDDIIIDDGITTNKIPKGFQVYSWNQSKQCSTPSGVAEDAMFHFCYKHGIPPESHVNQIITIQKACLPVGRDDIIKG